jgi:hypothetical protein
LQTRLLGVVPVHDKSLEQQSLLVRQLWFFTLHFHFLRQVIVKFEKPARVETAT